MKIKLALILIAALAINAGAQFVSDNLLIKFKPETSASSVAELHKSYGSKVIDEIPQISVQKISIQSYDVKEKYSKNPNVEFVEEDESINLQSVIPNDPYFASWQWGLRIMQTEYAWDITLGDPSVVIALIDTGIDYTHSELIGKVLPGYDFFDNDNDAMDENHHGTHMAGFIGAIANNGIGIAGITWNCKLLPVKVYNATGLSYYSIVSQGIIYAADQGARVINLSLGGPTSNSTLQSAVNYAYSKGAVLVGASGNNASLGVVYPAAYPNVLAVGASDDNDQFCSIISNYGPEIDVIAPDGGFSPCLFDRIESMGGTSSSAAYTSGVCGLVISANPSLTPAQTMKIIRDSADDKETPGWDMYTGYGRVNAYKACVLATGFVPPPPPPPPIVPTVTNQTFSGPITAGGVKTHSITISANSKLVASLKMQKANLDLYLLDAAGTILISSCTLNNPETFQINLTAGVYTLKVVDISGKSRYTLTTTTTSL